MQRNLLILTLGLAFMLACSPGPDNTAYQKTMLMLPEGDSQAGEEAFASLGCVDCHTVSWADGLPVADSGEPAPELGLDAFMGDPGRLATSIVAPAHHVSAAYSKDSPDGESPMEDVNSIMTVKQLSDIVAFLQRQGLETQSKM
jgi:mono/diheme cytochrome c family protein